MKLSVIFVLRYDMIYKFRREGYSVDYLVDFSVTTDLKNSSWRIMDLDQPGLGMAREYLIKVTIINLTVESNISAHLVTIFMFIYCSMIKNNLITYSILQIYINFQFE